MRREVITITIRAQVVEETAKPRSLGWQVKVTPGDTPQSIDAAITDACRQLRDEIRELVQ